MEWSGVEWSGVEWSGVEWSGVEWSGVEWSGVEWRGIFGRVGQHGTYQIRSSSISNLGWSVRVDLELASRYLL